MAMSLALPSTVHRPRRPVDQRRHRRHDHNKVPPSASNWQPRCLQRQTMQAPVLVMIIQPTPHPAASVPDSDSSALHHRRPSGRRRLCTRRPSRGALQRP